LGSVGNDFYGNLYENLVAKENIVPIFEKFDNLNTGLCCVFCFNRDRGHITDLGASVNISQEYTERVWEKIQNVQLIYTELFILKHKKNIVFFLAELALPNSKIFGFNLPSAYFIETYLNDIANLIEYADVVFANAAEAILLATLLGMEEIDLDTGDLSKSLVKFPKKNKNKKRVFVITAGPNAAHVAEYDFIQEKCTFYGRYQPEIVDDNLIIDTNGAGDAFAGGFLSRYVKNKSLEECMKAGHWSASIIIQTRGCQIPEENLYKSC